MQPHTKQQTPLAYTAEEVAERLGLSAWSVRYAVRKGELRAVKLGRRILIPAAALDEFLNGEKAS